MPLYLKHTDHKKDISTRSRSLKIITVSAFFSNELYFYFSCLFLPLVFFIEWWLLVKGILLRPSIALSQCIAALLQRWKSWRALWFECYHPLIFKFLIKFNVSVATVLNVFFCTLYFKLKKKKAISVIWHCFFPVLGNATF